MSAGCQFRSRDVARAFVAAGVAALLAAGCGASQPLQAAGDRRAAMGPMGGDAMSQPASPQAGGTPQLPGSLQGPLGPGAAWSTGQWPPRPRPWAQMGPEPPPQMGPAPHRPHLHPGEGVLDFMKTPHYWPGMRDPMAAYQAWLFWGRVQHGNPFFHHKQQYPELPHTPHAPGTHWGLPGYPGGPSQWPTGRLPPMR